MASDYLLKLGLKGMGRILATIFADHFSNPTKPEARRRKQAQAPHWAKCTCNRPSPLVTGPEREGAGREGGEKMVWEPDRFNTRVAHRLFMTARSKRRRARPTKGSPQKRPPTRRDRGLSLSKLAILNPCDGMSSAIY